MQSKDGEEDMLWISPDGWVRTRTALQILTAIIIQLVFDGWKIIFSSFQTKHSVYVLFYKAPESVGVYKLIFNLRKSSFYKHQYA